jgi:hypothetical protein
MRSSNILYEDPTLLVLQSDYNDIIWKGMAVGHKEGHRQRQKPKYSER